MPLFIFDVELIVCLFLSVAIAAGAGAVFPAVALRRTRRSQFLSSGPKSAAAKQDDLRWSVVCVTSALTVLFMGVVVTANFNRFPHLRSAFAVSWGITTLFALGLACLVARYSDRILAVGTSLLDRIDPSSATTTASKRNEEL